MGHAEAVLCCGGNFGGQAGKLESLAASPFRRWYSCWQALSTSVSIRRCMMNVGKTLLRFDTSVCGLQPTLSELVTFLANSSPHRPFGAAVLCRWEYQSQRAYCRKRLRGPGGQSLACLLFKCVRFCSSRDGLDAVAAELSRSLFKLYIMVCLCHSPGRPAFPPLTVFPAVLGNA